LLDRRIAFLLNTASEGKTHFYILGGVMEGVVAKKFVKGIEGRWVGL